MSRPWIAKGLHTVGNTCARACKFPEGRAVTPPKPSLGHSTLLDYPHTRRLRSHTSNCITRTDYVLARSVFVVPSPAEGKALAAALDRLKTENEKAHTELMQAPFNDSAKFKAVAAPIVSKVKSSEENAALGPEYLQEHLQDVVGKKGRRRCPWKRECSFLQSSGI